MPRRSPILVDIFCGAGGLSEGLRQAGFHPVLGLDWDRNSLSSYAANNPQARAICADVNSISASDVFDAAGTKHIDLIAGGPSCQGFSTHGKRVEDDPRNFLFREFVRLVREVRPKAFLMENVRGMLTYRKGAFRRSIESAFRRAGYNVVSGVVCAADYGVPQLRHRIVFLGTRLDAVPSLPQPTHGETGLFGLQSHVTVEDAIGDLPPMNGDFRREFWTYATPPRSDFQHYARSSVSVNVVTLHQANGLSPQARRLASFIRAGQGLRAVPVKELPQRFQRMRTIGNGALRKDCTTLYFRLSPDRPSYTITCYFRNVASGPFLHPYEDRSLSNREAARLMSFPDRYKFVGASIPRQIGNAVPPLMAKAIGRELLRLLGCPDNQEEDSVIEYASA
jgi:DNA (cytosine-5)-methyltransferase 1